MKLIDLLVRELPKRGGWRENWVSVTQDSDGYLCCWSYDNPKYNGFGWGHMSGRGLSGYFRFDDDVGSSCDNAESIITRDQYQSALAASQKAEWSGDGLPPVGEKVEFFINPMLGYRNDWIPDVGTEMEVVAHRTTTDGNDVVVCYWDDGGAGRSCCFVPESIKPLRSEADKKRDAACRVISDIIDENRDFQFDAKKIYDAIAAGKIPGVKLED